jgi:uncharacterized protein CbrC (UPF0167 family)
LAPLELPVFRYHPDPIATGSIQQSDEECICCGERRGYIYVGPVYAEDELDDQLCPWCIADGRAHDRFGAEFTDAESIGGAGWDEVPRSVIDSIAFRTPGFSGWQQERWFTHCRDGAAFLGRADCQQLRGDWAAAIPTVRDSTPVSDEEWDLVLGSLATGPTGSPTAYVFRCLHCGSLGGYWDSD